jgi:hypothetical protein
VKDVQSGAKLDSRKSSNKVYHLYPNFWRWSSKIDDNNLTVHSKMQESSNFGTKFSLRGRGYNIPGFETRNSEENDVCIAFMHRKSGKFSRF